MTFLGVTAQAGTAVRKQVTVGQRADGSPVALPVVLIRGMEPGPIAYLQAGLHGDEVTGIRILDALLRRIDPAGVRGTIAAVPVANPPAYLTRSRGYALEERGPIDMNRIFPGSAGGLLSERITSILFSEFVLEAELTLDVHSALAGCDIHPFVYVDPDDDEASTLDLRLRLARASAIPFIYRKPRGTKLGTSTMIGSLATQGDSAGRAVMIVEMGESQRISENYIDIGVTALQKMLAEFGTLPSPDAKAEGRSETEPVYFSRVHPIHNAISGLAQINVDTGTRVSAGDILARLHDPFTGDVTDVQSPVAGHVLRVMRWSPVATGAELAWVVS